MNYSKSLAFQSLKSTAAKHAVYAIRTTEYILDTCNSIDLQNHQPGRDYFKFPYCAKLSNVTIKPDSEYANNKRATN